MTHAPRATRTWRHDEASGGVGIASPRSAEALRELRAGFETLARLLAVTLGPAQGVVLSEIGHGSSESLVDSATIARRITSLPGRRQTAGAELVREMVRRVGGGYGDGGATAAVLAMGILRHATRMVAAGANPVLVRRGIQQGVAAACDALKNQARPVAGMAEGAGTDATTMLASLATATTGDPELGAVVGEMLDILGVDGAVQVEEHEATGLSYDYLDGARWRGRPADFDILPGASTELTLVEPVIAVADVQLETVEQVRPMLEAALALPGRPPLLVVAREITDAARSMFSFNDLRGTLVSAPAVITTSKTHLSDDLADLALLTGAQVLSPDLGQPPEAFRAGWFGRARRALVQRGYLTVSGGHGDSAEISDRAARLRTRAWELDLSTRAEDRSTRERLWLRQARLSGRVGALRVGAMTEQQIEARKADARKAVRLLTTALRDGVVPGGGVAYLDCLPALAACRESCGSADEAYGLDAVRAGLEQPFLQIVHNAGQVEPRVALSKARELGPGHGMDVRTHTYVDMRVVGICDVAGVLSVALEAAGETAGLLVSAEVVTGRG
jgi:chaperonin GroEL